MTRLAPHISRALGMVNLGFDKKWPDTLDLREVLAESRLSLLHAVAISAAVAASELVLRDPLRRTLYLDAKYESKRMLKEQKHPPKRRRALSDRSRGTQSAATMAMLAQENTAAPIKRLLSLLWVGFFRAESGTDYDPKALIVARYVVLSLYRPALYSRQVADRIRKNTLRIVQRDPTNDESRRYRTHDIEKVCERAFARWVVTVYKHRSHLSARLLPLIVGP